MADELQQGSVVSRLEGDWLEFFDHGLGLSLNCAQAAWQDIQHKPGMGSVCVEVHDHCPAGVSGPLVQHSC